MVEIGARVPRQLALSRLASTVVRGGGKGSGLGQWGCANINRLLTPDGKGKMPYLHSVQDSRKGQEILEIQRH